MKVQVLSPSTSQSTHMNIPIEVELSDQLLQRLLRESTDTRNKLGHIHRVAKDRQSKVKNM